MKRRTLVLRIWIDDTETVQGKTVHGETVHGQLADPITDWRQPFHDASELWTLITAFMADLPATPYLHRGPPSEFIEDTEQNRSADSVGSVE